MSKFPSQETVVNKLFQSSSVAILQGLFTSDSIFCIVVIALLLYNLPTGFTVSSKIYLSCKYLPFDGNEPSVIIPLTALYLPVFSNDEILKGEAAVPLPDMEASLNIGLLNLISSPEGFRIQSSLVIGLTLNWYASNTLVASNDTTSPLTFCASKYIAPSSFWTKPSVSISFPRRNQKFESISVPSKPPHSFVISPAYIPSFNCQ